MAPSDPKPGLTLEQKRMLYRDGYIIIKNGVSKELVEAALQRIRDASKGENLGGTREMTDLVNASSITPILMEAIGEAVRDALDPRRNLSISNV